MAKTTPTAQIRPKRGLEDVETFTDTLLLALGRLAGAWSARHESPSTQSPSPALTLAMQQKTRQGPSPFPLYQTPTRTTQGDEASTTRTTGRCCRLPWARRHNSPSRPPSCPPPVSHQRCLWLHFTPRGSSSSPSCTTRTTHPSSCSSSTQPLRVPKGPRRRYR